MDGDSGTVLNTTGLTDDQCKELHGYFVKGTLIWVVVAAVAHVLVWQWLPWFP